MNILSRRLRTNKLDNGWNAIIFFSRANSLISKRLNRQVFSCENLFEKVLLIEHVVRNAKISFFKQIICYTQKQDDNDKNK